MRPLVTVSVLHDLALATRATRHLCISLPRLAALSFPKLEAPITSTSTFSLYSGDYAGHQQTFARQAVAPSILRLIFDIGPLSSGPEPGHGT